MTESIKTPNGTRTDTVQRMTKTYYVQRNTIRRVMYREGCYVEAANPEDAKRIASEDGDWNTEREIECLSTDECANSYKVQEENA